MGTSIHPQSSQAQSLQFSMKKKKKSRKEKDLAGWGTFPSLLDSNLERNIG